MFGRFSLLAFLLLAFSLTALSADDAKPAAKTDPPADAKAAKRAARLKALEAEKAKADADAKAKADAEKPKEEKPKPEPKPLKTNTAALTKRIDEEIAKKLASE